MAHPRRFDPISIPAEHGFRRVHIVRCSRCDATDSVSANTQGGSRAHEDLRNIWRRRLWEIGANPRRDLCPACASAARKASRRTHPVPLQLVSDRTTPASEDTTMSKPAVAAEAPPTLGVQDALTIQTKLTEVYLDGARGYAEGWTDKRIAEDLDVPRDWVRQVRKMVYGEGAAGDNPDLAKELAEHRKLLTDARELVQKLARIDQNMNQLREERFGISERIERAEKRLGEIERLVR